MYKDNKGDIILSFAPFFQIAVLMLQEFLIESRLVEHESFRNISIALSALPMIAALFYIIKRKLNLLLIVYSVILFLILFTFIFFPDNERYIIDGAFYLLCINIPCFLCLVSIGDLVYLKKIILYLSYLIFVLGLIYCYFIWIGQIIFSVYSMSFSYYLLLPALVFVSQKKILFTGLFMLICMQMVFLGSRGGLVAAIIYAILLAFIDDKNRKFRLISTILMVILSGTLLSLFLKLSDKTGVTSRTLEMLQQGDISNSTGRLDIYDTIWNSILDSPYFGHGIYGDRVILDGIYCHNIFLEMFHNFGLFFGGGLILLILFSLIKGFLNSDNDCKKLLLMFFCYGFIPFLVSGSYLNNAEFGLFIGSLFLLTKNTFVEYVL